ncbi:MAG: chemotaxis protein CheX [Planctomycetes bacterium]|nr:chemotaxis protein CheX [Planctomycetota bacterium]
MKVDVNLINPFIAATTNALEMMAMVKPERKKVYLKTDNVLIGDISGIMGLSGDVSGSIILSFEAKTACKIVGNMLGASYDTIDDDVKDGIQEIVNLVAGQAKTMLADTEYHFQISIPTCIIGANHQVNHKKGVPCVVAEFDLEGSPFTLEVSIAPKSS